MVYQKKSKSKTIKTKQNYTLSGDSLTEQEFGSMVKEAEKSGYMSLEDFKKKCQDLLNFK